MLSNLASNYNIMLNSTGTASQKQMFRIGQADGMDLASFVGFVTELGSVNNAMCSLSFMTTGLIRVKKSSFFINIKSSMLRKVAIKGFGTNFN